MTATTDSSTTVLAPTEPDCGQATAKHYAEQTPSMYTKLPFHADDAPGLAPTEPDCEQATAKHYAEQTPSMYTKLPFHADDAPGLAPTELEG